MNGKVLKFEKSSETKYCKHLRFGRYGIWCAKRKNVNISLENNECCWSKLCRKYNPHIFVADGMANIRNLIALVFQAKIRPERKSYGALFL